MSHTQLNHLLPSMIKRQLNSNVWTSAIRYMQSKNKNKGIAQIRYKWDGEGTFDDKLSSIFVACILPYNDSHIEVMATIENPDPVVLDKHFNDLDNWLLNHVQSNPATWDDVKPIRNISYELYKLGDEFHHVSTDQQTIC